MDCESLPQETTVVKDGIYFVQEIVNVYLDNWLFYQFCLAQRLECQCLQNRLIF